MSGKGFQKVKELHSITNPIHYAFTAPSRPSAFLILYFCTKVQRKERCNAKRTTRCAAENTKSMLPEMHTHAYDYLYITMYDGTICTRKENHYNYNHTA